MEFESPPHLGGHPPAYMPAPVYAPVPPPTPAPSTPSRRGGPFAMVGGLVVLALVAVALLAFTGRRERSAEERLAVLCGEVVPEGGVGVGWG